MIFFWPVYVTAAIITGLITAFYLNDEGYSAVETFCGSFLATICWWVVIFVCGFLTLLKFVRDTW